MLRKTGKFMRVTYRKIECRTQLKTLKVAPFKCRARHFFKKWNLVYKILKLPLMRIVTFEVPITKLNLNIQHGAVRHVYGRGMLSVRSCFHGVRDTCRGSSGVCLSCHGI